MSNFLVRISTVVLLLVTLFTLSFFFFLVLGESFKKEKKMLLVRSFHFLFSPLGWKGGAALFAFLSDFDLHLSLSCYISSSESSNWVERSSELQALEESFSEEVAQPNPVGPAEKVRPYSLKRPCRRRQHRLKYQTPAPIQKELQHFTKN